MSKWYDGSFIVSYCIFFLFLICGIFLDPCKLPKSFYIWIQIINMIMNTVYVFPICIILSILLVLRISVNDNALFGKTEIIKQLIVSGRILKIHKASLQQEFIIKFFLSILLFLYGFIYSFFAWEILLLLTEFLKFFISNFYFKYDFDKFFENKNIKH